MPPPRATPSRTLRRLVVLLALFAWYCPCGAAELFRDDFSGFPPGWLTRPVGQLNAAIQEYYWDQERVWVYTQDRPCSSDRVYRPVRNPDYNESNYRTVVSRPTWAWAGPKASER